MKQIAAVILLLTVSLVYADDTFVYRSVGGTLLNEDARTTVVLKSETINIDLLPASYAIDVTFEFENMGPEQTVGVGFPLWSKSDPSNTSEGNFVDFSTYVDGKAVPFEQQEVSEYKKDGFTAFYVKKVQFKANGPTETRVTYQSKYSDIAGTEVAAYLIGTGRTWGTRPWNTSVKISNKSSKWIFELRIGDVSAIKLRPGVPRVGEIGNRNDLISVELKDFLPSRMDDIVEIWFDDRPGPFLERDTDYYSEKPIEANQLKVLTRDQLRLLRNAFFAAHGYRFGSEELSRFFSGFAWYHPKGSFSKSELTDQELENIKMIGGEEADRDAQK